MAPISSLNLDTYVRVGRYDLPEPTRTTAPSGNLLAQEASAVTYNWDDDSLYVLGDGGTAIVRVSKTGQLLDSMTLAKGSSPQGTAFYDPEGLAYIGNNKFVLIEERDRQVVQFSYSPGTTLTRADTKTVKLGTTIGNIGIEGVSYDPTQSNGYIFVKELDPEGIFQSSVDFSLVSLGSISNGGGAISSNGNSTTVNSTNLFNPALAGLDDFADVYALANVATAGSPIVNDLLILSQESGKVVQVGRDGTLKSSLTILLDPGSSNSVADQTHEGVAMDRSGRLYIVSENGGGDVNHPQLWVYAPATSANTPPSGIVLNNAVTSIYENIPITAPFKLADIALIDDGLGTNGLTFSITGPDADKFQADLKGLFLKAGTILDYETKTNYSINIQVDDPTVGSTPDASIAYKLNVIDVVDENAPLPLLRITEASPWSSGNSLYKADWFEVTNFGSTSVSLSGIRMDDNSNAFGSSVALNGVSSLLPGQSAVFIESPDPDPATIDPLLASFRNAWFGSAPSDKVQLGWYSGSGVGLSTSADAVNIFDRFGRLISGIQFPASTTYKTFDNSSGIGSSSFPTASISSLSTQFASATPATGTTFEIGTPGSINGSLYSFGASTYTVSEPDSNGGSGNVQLQIQRSGDLSSAGSVKVIFSDGSARGAAPAPAQGINKAPSSSQNSYILPTSNSGTSFTALLTTGDTVGGAVMAGIPDGLGAFDNGDGTFTVLMNQEIGNTLGAVRAHGGKGAFVSSWVVNKSDLSVISGSDLITNVYTWNSTTQASNPTPNNKANNNGIIFNRFCSADLAPVSAFYNPNSGLGTQNRLFLNGEEGGSTGFALANVASGTNKGDSFVLGKFNLSTNGSGLTGVGGWENLLANWFPQDKTVVIGNNDGGSGLMNGTVVVYQGSKTATGSDAERAGLMNGGIKFVAVNGFADANGSTVDELSNLTTRTTAIANGTRFSLSATTSTTFSRPEDGAWDPNNPNVYYFVTTDQIDQLSDGIGTQIGQTRLWRLTFDDITNPDLGGKIDLLIDGDVVNGKKVNMFDNITIDKYGHILLLEDPGNNSHNSKIWQYDVNSDSLKLVGQVDPAKFGDIGVPPTAPYIVDEETSGIIDLQSILGPGYFMLTVQDHHAIADPNQVEGGQLVLMFNPDTYRSYSDYGNTSQVVNFGVGESTKTINVPIFGDSNPETSELFTASLATPTGSGLIGAAQPTTQVTITNLDPTPTNILISSSSVNENVAVGTLVGTLSSSSPVSGLTYGYSLVSGSGDSDNSAFAIDGNRLILKVSPDFEAKSSYSIRVRSTQQGGSSYDKTLAISVTDINEAAVITGVASASVKEGTGLKSSADPLKVSGNLSVSDPDAGQSKFQTNVESAPNNVGSLQISEAGLYSYSVNNNDPRVQQLGAGQTKTDSFTVKSLDGTASQVISITINGTAAGFNGVGAGDPSTNSVTLWTRTYDSADLSGRTPISENIRLQLSPSSDFATIAYQADGISGGTDRDGTVKFNVSGLNSNSTYYYRFQTLSGELSQAGRFRTAPQANQAVAVKIGHSGDVDGLMRPYPLMAGIGEENFNLFIFNGDTIYETASTGSAATPATRDAELGTVSQQTILDAYHRKYLENLLPSPTGTFKGLQTFFASQGIVASFDNHELGNKALINGGAPAALSTTTANGTANTTYDVNTTGAFINDTATFETLLQAFNDYLPIRNPDLINAPADPRSNGEQKYYNAQAWGKNAMVINLDTRTFRDVRLNKAAGGDDTGARADNPNRTLLGATQKAWFKQTLLDAKAAGSTWIIINVTDPIDQIGAYGSGLDGGKSWFGGYRAERNEILKFIDDNKITNVIFLASDDHQARINELTYLADSSKDPSNPANYKRLSGVYSIVDGPMGATGPDNVTDHSFTNIKSIADSLAKQQSDSGLDPIGLDAKTSGLFNLFREGDATAATAVQPVDFFSPDTNNYISLDISSNGILTVNLRGSNSYAQNSFPEPSALTSPRTLLSFALNPTPSTYKFSAASYASLEPAAYGSTANLSIRIDRSGGIDNSETLKLVLSGGTATGASAAPAEAALKGPSSSATPYMLPIAGSGVVTRSLLSTGDSIGGYKMAGIPDGLGAFDNNDGTFTLLMNHEIGSTLGSTRAHGGIGAFVSSWVINKSDLSVVSGSDLIKNVYAWNSTTQASSSTANNAANGNGISFSRFCSADLAPTSAFFNAATGRGTEARIFLNGEEGGSTGFALANIASGANKGDSFVLGKFNLSTDGSGKTGIGGWENLLANWFPQDKTVVIGNNDGGTNIMSNSVVVYQGLKTTTGTDADKAGLTNGAIKFVTVNGISNEISNATTQATAITSGMRFSLSADASTTFSRPEDGAWDPSNPNRYYFVTTNRLDTVADGLGTQVGQTRLWRLNFDDITNPDLGGSIDLLVDGDTVNGQKVNMFDNITIDRYGHILLQEDVGNAAHNGKIWQYDIATDSLKPLSKFDPDRFGDVNKAATSPFNQDEESSGIIDVQDILGPGWFLFDSQAHYLISDPAQVEGGQLLALFNPDTYRSGVDYVNTTQTVSFAAGETSKTVTIPVLADGQAETLETFNISLTNPSLGGTIDAPALVSILDNSTPPISYLIETSSSLVNEGASFTTTVKTTGLPTDTSLFWAMSGAGITASDLSAGSLRGWGAVNSSGSFSFSTTLANDFSIEGKETIELRLFTDAARTSQVGNTAVVTIADTSYYIAGPSTIGTTNLGTTQRGYAIKKADATPFEISWNGQIVSGSYPGNGWQATAATANGAGYDLYWKNSSTGQFARWQLNGSGAQTGGTMLTAQEFYGSETTAGIDFDGDGITGLPFTPGANSVNGVTLGTSPVGYAIRSAGGSIALVTNQGKNASTSNPGNGWLATAATANGSGYDLYWKNSSSGQFARWQLNGSGAVTSGLMLTGQEFYASEVTVGSDLDGDGITGLPFTPVSSISGVNLGTTPLGYAIKSGASNVALVTNQGKNASATNPGNGWQAIAAAAGTGAGFDLYWQNTASNQYALWKLGGTGAVDTSTYLTMAQLFAAETSLNFDLNKSGTIGS